MKNGGIGKLSLWLFFLGLFLGFLASVNLLALLGIIAAVLVGAAISLAIVGLFLGDENARRSKIVLLVFSAILLVFIALLILIGINAD